MSLKAAILLSVSFFAAGVAECIFILNEQKTWFVYASLVSFTIAYGILAFVLFRIGVQSFKSHTEDMSEFELSDTEE